MGTFKRLSEEDQRWVRRLYWIAQELSISVPRTDKDCEEPEVWEVAADELAGVLMGGPAWARICPECDGDGWVEVKICMAGDQQLTETHTCPMCEGRPL